MRSAYRRGRRQADAGRPAGDEGRIPILVAGFLGILMLLILGAVDVTAVQLARIRVLDAADAASADAADAIDRGSVYGGGIGQDLRLTDAGVSQVAGEHLGSYAVPQNVTSWSIGSGTGTPDGRTAVVRVNATIHPPISGRYLPFMHDVNVSMESRARADVDP